MNDALLLLLLSSWLGVCTAFIVGPAQSHRFESRLHADAGVVDDLTKPEQKVCKLMNQLHHPLASRRHHHHYYSRTATAATFLNDNDSVVTAVVGPRLAIRDDFPGLQKIHSQPDIFVLHEFLNAEACQDLILSALDKTMERSPVAYAGWTDDVKDLVELAAKGPVAWIALIAAWVQVKDNTTSSSQTVDLVVHALQNYAVVFVLATALIAAFTYSRAQGLKSLRTSTSTTLDDLSTSGGTRQFVQQAAKLFQSNDSASSLRDEAALFEAPTVIRYEAGQVLAPHYDANRSAETEDANRGGQTLATLIVYLNDVQDGGLTRFGKLQGTSNNHRDKDNNKLVIRPKQGDALLFFPADRSGTFDPRTEHEGMPAVDEKWIARIWRHKQRVPPPFGLSESALEQI